MAMGRLLRSATTDLHLQTLGRRAVALPLLQTRGCQTRPGFVNLMEHMHPVVRYQETGDCWAVASVECLQAVYHMNTGIRLLLSPQHIVDCAPRVHVHLTQQQLYLPLRERPGHPLDALLYMKNHGVALETDWPHMGNPINRHGLKIRIGDYGTLSGHSEMIQKLNTPTPIIGGFAMHPILINYKRGIVGHPTTAGGMCTNINCGFHGKEVTKYCNRCGTGMEFHAAAICGYTPWCWILKNTWGQKWGMQGFFRILRRLNNSNIDPIEVLGTIYPTLYHTSGVLNLEAEACYLTAHKSWKKQ